MRRRIAAVGGPLLLAALAAAPALAQPAAAPRGALTLSPAAPIVGARVAVSYTDSSGAFAGTETLVLRGVVRRADDYVFENAPPAQRLAALVRRADGTYAGTLALPADAAYARLAVERADGLAVDARGGGWELLVSDADGRPTFAALRQRGHEAFGRSWVRTDDAARRMTELFPDSAEGWVQRWQLQQLVLGGAGRDSARADHLARLALFLAVDDAAISADERAMRARYATMLGDSAAARRWSAASDGAGLALRERVGRLVEDRALAPTAALDSLERWWARSASADFLTRRALAHAGLAVAARAVDDAAALRWGERFAERPTLDAVAPLAAYVRIPALRRHGIEGLRSLLAAVARDADAYRSLDRPRDAPVPEADGLTGHAGMLLAQAQRAEGDSAGARATLAVVSERVPYRTYWRQVAPLQLALGDTAAATTTLARLAAHPETPPAQADSAREQAVRLAGAARFAAATDTAAAEQRARARAGGVRRALPATVRLTTADGRATTLRELAAGAPTLVVHWSRSCGFSRQAMPGIARAARALRAAGVRVLLETTEAPNAELLAYADEHGIRDLLVSDVHRDLVRALDATDTPSYYLLDAAGVLRHDRTDLASVRIQAAALRDER